MSRPARYQLYCKALKPGALDYLTRDEIMEAFSEYDQVKDVYRPAAQDYFFVELSSREGINRALKLHRINQFFVNVQEALRSFFPGDRMTPENSLSVDREPLPDYERDRFGAKAATREDGSGRRWGRILKDAGGREWDKGKMGWIGLEGREKKKGGGSEQGASRSTERSAPADGHSEEWAPAGGHADSRRSFTGYHLRLGPPESATHPTERRTLAHHDRRSSFRALPRSRSPPPRRMRVWGAPNEGLVSEESAVRGASRARSVGGREETALRAQDEEKRAARRREAMEVVLRGDDNDEEEMAAENEVCVDSVEELEARLDRDARILIIRNLAEECTVELLEGFGSQDDLQVISAGAHSHFSGEGFIEWSQPDDATRALLTLNGRKILGVPIRLQRL